MRTSLRILMMTAALGMAVTAAASGVYRWVDANGKVHYGDQPPPDSKAQTVDVPHDKPAPSAAPAAAATAEPKDPVRKQQCELAKAIVAKYEAAPHLLKRRPDGKVHQLTPEEQAKTIADAKAQVAKNCNPDRPTDDLGPSPNARPKPAQADDNGGG